MGTGDDGAIVSFTFGLQTYHVIVVKKAKIGEWNYLTSNDTIYIKNYTPYKGHTTRPKT